MRRRRTIVLLAGALWLSVLPAGAEGEFDGAAEALAVEHELGLVVGENRTISAVGVRNFSEGVAGIVDVKLTTDRSQFVISGRRAGTTSLLLIHRDGSQRSWVINVFQRAPQLVHRELAQLLASSPGVLVRSVGTRFFLEGSATDEGELARIERIAALYPGQVESLVVLGAAPTDSRVNIRVDFFFVQYDKRSGYAFGVDWPARVGGAPVHSEVSWDLTRGTTTTATASVSDQPLPALDLAANHGWAKVIEQSTVITANGSPATFQSGGEQNYSISAAQTASIQPIEYGLKVDVLPRLDTERGELEIGIDADVAHLVPAAAGSVLPGRATSKLKTTVRIRLGQSLILSGIRTTARRSTVSGLPVLSEIPVFGVLFGSHRGEAEDVESAVFVIPSAVESVPRPAAELVNSALAQFEEFAGDFAAVDAFPKRSPAWEAPRPSPVPPVSGHPEESHGSALGAQ